MLSTDEQKRLCKIYLKWQREYNETQDRRILWNHLRPLLVDMIGNCTKKKCGNHFIEDFEHRLESQVDRVIKRYIDNPQYNRDLPMTIAYWESINLLYGSSHDKLTGNYDHEFEYENAPYTEEDKNIKLVDIRNNRILFDYEDRQFSIIKAGDKTDEVIEALEKEGWRLKN